MWEHARLCVCFWRTAARKKNVCIRNGPQTVFNIFQHSHRHLRICVNVCVPHYVEQVNYRDDAHGDSQLQFQFQTVACLQINAQRANAFAKLFIPSTCKRAYVLMF